jgi:exopolysaccharide biosynthesis polyprenyl glycosylphosphotransferase
MFLRIDTLTPGVTRNAKIAADCGVLVLASISGTISADWTFDAAAALATIAVSAAVWLIGSRFLGHYDSSRRQDTVDELCLVTILVIAVAGAIALLRTAFPADADAIEWRRHLILLWPGAILLRLALPRPRVLGPDEPEDVLVIGTGALGRHTAWQLREQERIHGAVHYLSLPGEARSANLPGTLLGASDDLERVLRERAFHEVYIAGSSLKHGRAMQSAIRVCERFGVPFALPANHFRFDRARPADPRAFADGYVHYLSVEHKPFQMAIKRVLDIVGSSLALILLSPVLVVVALVIAVTSRGPVLFRQVRVGRYGRPFHMLKFRSMVIDAEAQKQALMARNEQRGPVFKIKDDPRVTRIGRIIRKYSIDELPQFINVLRGDMSIVGPRPPVPSEVEKYEAWQRRRLSVRPGITCIWQVSGRNEISFEQWMYLDMQYIDHWSLVADIKLLLKTFPVVVSGRGAS